MALSQQPEPIDGSNLPRPYEDVRQWLDLVESMGELKRVNGADWNLEIGALAELIYRERSGTIPALLFDQVKGVWSLESGIGSLFNVISIKQAYPGHSRQRITLARWKRLPIFHPLPQGEGKGEGNDYRRIRPHLYPVVEGAITWR